LAAFPLDPGFLKLKSGHLIFLIFQSSPSPNSGFRELLKKRGVQILNAMAYYNWPMQQFPLMPKLFTWSKVHSRTVPEVKVDQSINKPLELSIPSKMVLDPSGAR
jgi:hypothetical protein